MSGGMILAPAIVKASCCSAMKASPAALQDRFGSRSMKAVGLRRELV
jgi:hypothetical protein